jgi:hypothetical protein
MTSTEDKGAVRRLRNKIINRGHTIESIKPYGKEEKAYVRGLEYALEAIDHEFPDVI